MLKVFRRAATAVWVLAIAPFLAHAQQPIRDPLGGQFGAMEIAMSPKAALRDAELLGAALSGLKPQRPGVVDAYVFAASLWNDPVFEREASEAARILAQRFDAEGRTVILSAGAGAPDRAYPAASPNNVNAALAKIGATIDPAEDLVVVFLTSHGSPDGAVALQEKNRMGGAMRAAHLRASLNAAGVRNRVVIVSACYSGAFIQPFSDAFTAVFTAAAADRPSFGCQPDRDWTYFGDAFLNRALRTSAGIEQAFDVSLSTILDWEQKLAAEWSAKPPALRAREPEPQPSNPQKHVGASVAPLIAKAERYGVAVQCAAQAARAIREQQAGRPVEGAPDAITLERLRKDYEMRAAQFALVAKRTPDETQKAIAAASRSPGSGCLTSATAPSAG
jgi:hypothetical protein